LTPAVLCLSVCLFMSVTECLSVCVTVCLCHCVCLSVCLCHCLSVSVFLCHCVSVCVWSASKLGDLLTPAPLSDRSLENHTIFRVPIIVVPGQSLATLYDLYVVIHSM